MSTQQPTPSNTDSTPNAGLTSQAPSPVTAQLTSHEAVVAAAVAALTSIDLAGIVDFVAWSNESGIHVANSAGSCHFGRDGKTHTTGTDPLASQDPMAFLPYTREVVDASPPNSRNSYPLARQRLASFFADPTRSPDLVVVHTPRHYFPEQLGHVGEHGSLDAIQSRAPFLIAGAGLKTTGYLDDYARLVDVAATMAWLAGVPEPDLVDADGVPIDGRPRTDVVDAVGQRVIGILWDGGHCGELLAMAEGGELPGVARLIDRGVALRGGGIAEFPSVTLTNHTSLLTGVGPGRHGVLGNMFYDRATNEVVVPNDSTTWHKSAQWLRPGVRTVFEMVGDAGGSSVSLNEAIDRGSNASTMALIRAAGVAGASGLDHLLPDATNSPFVVNDAHLTDEYYAWSTQVDDAGLTQVLQAWADVESAPRFTWWANIVTDAGHHAGGPRSELARDSLRDSDRRLQAFLDHLEGLGVLDDVTIVLTADHGFEGADLSVRGEWASALAGLPLRDVGPGMLYVIDSDLSEPGAG